MSTAALLTRLETCERAGYWARGWERRKLDGTEMLAQAVGAGLTEVERSDYGEVAGETVMDLAEHRGLSSRTHQVYDSAVHHAALADIITATIRPAGKPPWRPVEPLDGTWTPSCYVDASGSHLRRVLLVSAWSDERHHAEMRSWHSFGEVCHYEMPMQQVVIVLGQLRDGKRHGPFSKGFMHPQGSHLRFRRKSKSTNETFNANWRQVWREDVGGDISVERWLQGMLDDDILRDTCFPVDVPVPDKQVCARVRSMAAARLDALHRLKVLPDENLSTCFWPVQCVFQPECHAGRKPDGNRFVQIV